MGGSAAAVARIRPLLRVMGRKVVHGGSAAGQAAEIGDNMGLTLIATCGACAQADRLFGTPGRIAGMRAFPRRARYGPPPCRAA